MSISPTTYRKESPAGTPYPPTPVYRQERIEQVYEKSIPLFSKPIPIPKNAHRNTYTQLPKEDSLPIGTIESPPAKIPQPISKSLPTIQSDTIPLTASKNKSSSAYAKALRPQPTLFSVTSPQNDHKESCNTQKNKDSDLQFDIEM